MKLFKNSQSIIEGLAEETTIDEKLMNIAYGFMLLIGSYAVPKALAECGEDARVRTEERYIPKLQDTTRFIVLAH